MSPSSLFARRSILLLVTLAILRAHAVAAAAECTYYASPAGGGDGSPSKPFRVASFWKLARPGAALCLLDGSYDGAESMISPPAGLSGSKGAPIVVRAMNEGKVLITGEGVRAPVLLNAHNDWFVVEGIDACCSGATVVEISQSSNVTIRRVAAWDAHDGNDKIFGVHYGQYNTLEDVAGWGTARKTFEFSYGGDFTTVRRAWGRWERSTVSGPKMVYSLAYNNYHALIENSLGTWSGGRMPETYVLKDYFGKPYAGPGGGVQRHQEVAEAYGVFSMDGIPAGKKADARLIGSLAYVSPTDLFQPDRLVFVTKMDGVQIKNTAAYFPPTPSFQEKRTFGLYPLGDGTKPVADLAENISGFGGAGPEIRKGWAVRNELHGRAPGSTYGTGESVFNTVRGANLCRRYENGAPTQTPLWPWPMNQRILAAMARSGREPVDVTAAIETMFGPIPNQCRNGPSSSSTRDRVNEPRRAPASGRR